MIQVTFQGNMFEGTISFTLEFVPRVGDQVTISTQDSQGSLVGTVTEINWLLSDSGHSAAISLASPA